MLVKLTRSCSWTGAALARATSVRCGQLESGPVEAGVSQPQPGRVVATRMQNSAPDGTDAPPRVSLARLTEDGAVVPIPGDYVHAVAFRVGQAAVTGARELYLVRGDASKSLLARHVDGLPAQADDGALVYTARFGDTVEIHWLSLDGTNHRLASFQGSATRLSPQGERQVVFVGAKRGGVSGTWIADAQGARCLTNCALRVGKPWGDAYRAPPGDGSKVRIVGYTVEWQTAQGAWDSATLGGGR